MGFSPEWEGRFSQGQNWSLWPWSDLVSFVMRHARPTSNEFRVLEIGAGVGANIPFFEKMNVQFFAMEGSRSAVDAMHKRFPGMKERIACGDFTREIVFPGTFDLIYDRGAMTCNSTADIQRTLSLVRNALKPGGKYLGIDWFSTTDPESRKGKEDGDAFTRRFDDGPHGGLGRIHFFDEKHIRELMHEFKLLSLEERVVRTALPARRKNPSRLESRRREIE